MPSHPASTPSTPTDLPEHLVETVAARGLRRLGVGTLPFTIASVLTLTAMSAFVVMSPSVLPSQRDVGASEPTEASASSATGSADESTSATSATTAPSDSSRTSAPSTTAETSGSSAPTTSSDRSSGNRAEFASTRSGSTTTTTAPKTAPGKKPPVSAGVVTCDDFTLQPEAQAALDADPIGRAGLDGDGDGLACEHLPGKPATPAAPTRRIPSTSELLHPDTRLYGVHTPQAPFAMSEVDAFEKSAKKAPNTVLFFQNLAQDFPASAIAASWNRGLFPMITFEPIIQNSTTGQPKLADLANGLWDNYFRSWAEAAKAEGHPIGFRFGQEMNGNWYPWSDGRFGNAAGDFILAWRHIHDIFSEVGADNVIWVWSINRVDNLPDKTLERVYPGGNYVDWIGVSGYLRTLPEGTEPTFDFTFAATLAKINEVAPNKLVMLTEVGAGTTEANRTAWMASFFAALLEHPEIIGFNWFNDFKDGGDWRIQYSTATAAAFAKGVANDRYGELAPET